MFEAKSNGDGTYAITRHGVAVVGARIMRINFSSVTTHTLHGAIHHIGGPCVATIFVPGVGTVENVKVVF
jgi:hypothetical protein